jgi:P-type Cu2+ transporter
MSWRAEYRAAEARFETAERREEAGHVNEHSGHDAPEAPEVDRREREHELRRPVEQSRREHGQGHDHSGPAGHAGVYRRRFWINLILALPVVVYSEMIQD